MTRNELRLEIWNRLNVCPLNETQLETLKKELSEEELGIFVDLFTDYVSGPAFISDKRHQEEMQAIFEDLTPVKEMTEKYRQMSSVGLMAQMRGRLRIDYLDDSFNCLTDLLKEIEAKSGTEDMAYQIIDRIRDYVRLLRIKADIPDIEGIDKAEALMLEVIAAEEDVWTVSMIASLFCLFTNDISNVEAAVHFFNEKKMFIEQYARYVQNEIDGDE